MKILELSRQLGEELRNSDEFKKYQQLREKCREDRELEEKINEFKIQKKVYDVESAREDHDEEMLGVIKKRLDTLYEEIYATDIMKEFTVAEDNFNILLNAVNMAITSYISEQPATAEGGWAWDFGNRPAFVDGQEIEYRVEEDSVEGYETNIKGFNITNVLGGAKQSTHLSGMVFWTDNNNAGHTRPQSVTVNLLKNGEKIASQEVTKDEDGIWFVDFGWCVRWRKGRAAPRRAPHRTARRKNLGFRFAHVVPNPRGGLSIRCRFSS